MTGSFATLSSSFQWQMPALPGPGPAAEKPFLTVAAALAEAGDAAAATAVLAEGLRRHPGAAELAALRDRIAGLPGDEAACLAAAARLRGEGRSGEAEALLAKALRQFPGDAGLAREHAWCAHDRGDHEVALTRWEALRRDHPALSTGWWMMGHTLGERLGRLAEAEHAIAAAMERFPDDRFILAEHAKLPGLAGDWGAGLRRWTALAGRFPDDARIAAGRGDAEMKLGMQEADVAPPGSEAVVPRRPWMLTIGGAVPGSAHRDLMLRFESLGVSCEFGLVQRHFGAEPLGLFRWSSIHPEHLAVALEQRLDGIEREEDITMKDLAGEYTEQQNRYRMAMHSFISATDSKADPDRLRPQFARRMRFLRDKLLADIAAGEKIFVYQYPRLLDPAHMARLLAAFRACGPATIMFVHDVASDRPPGHVERIGPGCLMAQMDRLVQDGDWSKVSAAAWLEVCRNAAALAGPPAG